MDVLLDQMKTHSPGSDGIASIHIDAALRQANLHVTENAGEKGKV
jgi:hypothetical protein